MDPFRKRKIFLNQLNQDLKIEFNLNSLPLNEEQIDELARLNPVKISDLEAVKGLGIQFQQKYGELIISRLQAFNLQFADLNYSNQIQMTLSELQKRLINISKRNRLLYVGKTSAKTNFDLAFLGDQQLQKLLFENLKVKLVDLKQDQTKKNYASLCEIYKTAQRIYKETGNFDLYIATPFVTGTFVSNPFTLRAPLALFPVQLEITNQAIFVQLDNEKDVLINTNLIIAAQNFLKTNLPLIPMNLEEVSQETFLDDLIEAYKQQGLTISNLHQPLQGFESKTIDSFSSQKPGIFEVENVALLGYFPILSTSIQRDYAKITQLSSYPQHVLTLLETLTQDENLDEIKLDDVVFNEQHLAYINPLNTSQEQAQLQIKKGQHIVIQGPPGTGKSQTISNVIAQSIFDKKNVLMVSEKKAAIDVVYSRLGKLNQYALILDNINDKLNFYRQCENIFSNQPSPSQPASIENQNQAMNDLIDDLSHLKSLLMTPISQHQTLLDLYSHVKKIDYKDPQVFKQYQFLKETVPQSLLQSYDALQELQLDDDFDKKIQYIKLKNSIPSFDRLNLTLSDYDIMSLKQQLPQIKQELAEFNQLNFIKKLFNNGKDQIIIQPFQKLISDVTSSDLESVDLVLDNYTLISQPQKIDNKEIYLLIDRIKQYFSMDSSQSLSLLINFLGFELIQNFENSHREIHDLINHYPQIIDSFNESALEKSDLLVQQLSYDLHQKRFDLNNSKRALEMKRIIERKRKWSIAKFVDKFYVELFDGVKIWLCTPDVVSEIFPLQPDLFDVLIFDEASQLYIEKAIPSIYRCKQVVIAGDSQQLRPSAFGVGRFGYDEELEDEFVDSTAALDEESLLDLARFKFPSMTLNYHYRSLFEELIAFSNAAFYKNQLIVSPNALVEKVAPITRIKVENGQWIKRANQQESTAVVNLIKELSLNRENNETIGVITFNATQRALIENDLETLASQDKDFNDFYQAEIVRTKDNQDLSLFVKNIENVQGDERDIIIFSITYAPDENGKVPSFYGWLSQQGGQNRLNVAITRAKRQIYVVTSIEPEQLPVANATALGPKILQQYLAYAKAISQDDSTTTKRLLNELSAQPVDIENKNICHPLTAQVIKQIELLGYQTKHQFGIGQFNIEVAVFKNQQLICGFEFDHHTYPTEIDNDRARDIHQPNYLKARGWHITRLFSYDYYHDQAEFFQSIETTIKENDKHHEA